jgi:hypothetical protein
MALRWCAAGMLEAGKQFRRVNGHLHLKTLRAALAGQSREAWGTRCMDPSPVRAAQQQPPLLRSPTLARAWLAAAAPRCRHSTKGGRGRAMVLSAWAVQSADYWTLHRR